MKGRVDAMDVVDENAGDKATRRSRTGFIAMMNGGLISWCSRLLSIVTLSNTEAEYYAMTDATQEALWLRSLLTELGFMQHGATVVYEDNKGARDLCKNPVYPKRTRHIEVKYHFVRRHVKDGTIEVCGVPSKLQLADFLTKPYAELARQLESVMTMS